MPVTWMRGTYRALLVACAVAAALLAARPAGATVNVTMGPTSTGGVVVAVTGDDRFNTPATFVLEHFADISRNGIRVRERGLSEPEPFIRSDDADCEENVFFNDVVCQPFPTEGRITTRGGEDIIDIGGSNAACETTGGTPFTVDLGGGNDRLFTRTVCGGSSQPGVNRLYPRYVSLRGGDGDDDLNAGRLDDTLFGDGDDDEVFGNDGGDTLFGGAGQDILSGDGGGDVLNGGPNGDSLNGGSGGDILSGEDGEDTLRGGTEGDRLNGGSGDDALHGDDGADEILGSDGDDTLRGGSGDDTLSGGGDGALGAGGQNDTLRGGSGDDTLNGGNNGTLFGESGNDILRGGGVDTLDGGTGADEIRGNFNAPVTVTYASSSGVTATLDGVANDGTPGEGDNLIGLFNVIGSPGADSITAGPNQANVFRGGGGNDTLEGQDRGDTLVGGFGTDTLRGQAGNDSINSQDGIVESVSCGSGFDSVFADLRDEVPVSTKSTDLFCESITRFAVDDGPPGRILGRALRIQRDGAVKLRLECPRRARVDCRGILRLTKAGRSRRTLSAVRYSVPLGRTRTVHTKLSRRAARQARRAKLLIAATRERGVSRKGSRRSSRGLRVLGTRR